MLVACGTSRETNRSKLASAARRAEIPTCLEIKRTELTLSFETWTAYWRPCRGFFQADRRLVHRIVQLKKAWVALLRAPSRKARQRAFCWRYFALLHQALNIARAEPDRGDPIPVLHRIIAFESFPIAVRGSEGAAAGVIAGRNPIYLLGRLQAQAPLPTPRHVPVVHPLGQVAPFYCYRQLPLSSERWASLLVFPAVDLRERRASFGPIDRLTRLVSSEPDPRARRRARLLARRVLVPLIRAQSGVSPHAHSLSWTSGRAPDSLLRQLGRKSGGSQAAGAQPAPRCISSMQRDHAAGGRLVSRVRWTASLALSGQPATTASFWTTTHGCKRMARSTGYSYSVLSAMRARYPWNPRMTCRMTVMPVCRIATRRAASLRADNRLGQATSGYAPSRVSCALESPGPSFRSRTTSPP